MATVGGSLGPATPLGEMFLLAGNVGLFLSPAGSAAGALYVGDRPRTLWIGLDGVGSLFLDVAFGELYSFWAAWDAFHLAQTEPH